MAFEYLIQTYGYIVLFLGTFLEGETVLVIAGFMAHRGHLEMRWVIPCAMIGSMCGDQLFFFLGRAKGRSFIEARPKWKRRAERIQPLLDRYRDYIVLSFRFFYGLRNVTPFIIGATGAKPFRFFVLNAIGALLWAIVVGYLGFAFGGAVQLILRDVRKYEVWFFVVIVVVGCAAWFVQYHRNRRRLAADLSSTGDGLGNAPKVANADDAFAETMK